MLLAGLLFSGGQLGLLVAMRHQPPRLDPSPPLGFARSECGATPRPASSSGPAWALPRGSIHYLSQSAESSAAGLSRARRGLAGPGVALLVSSVRAGLKAEGPRRPLAPPHARVPQAQAFISILLISLPPSLSPALRTRTPPCIFNPYSPSPPPPPRASVHPGVSIPPLSS